MFGQEYLQSILEYNPDTGVFKWKALVSQTQNKRTIGSVAGCINKLGYCTIGIKGKLYKGQRLAWLYMTGEWPIHDIDHINGVRSDNRFSNLRDITRTHNAQNRRSVGSRTTSGYLGVSWCWTRLLWLAHISVYGKQKHLGYFGTPEDAYHAYLQAKRQFHVACTI